MTEYMYLGREVQGSCVKYKIVDIHRKVYSVTKEDLIRVLNSGVKVHGIKVDKLGRIHRISDNKRITQVRGNGSTRSSNKIILYHGSPNKDIKITYGLGEDKHDYGRGFYLTADKELAKEWATCSGNSVGYLHVFCVELAGLKVLDFDNLNNLSWIAELMKHRDADNSVRYRVKSKEFIEKYGIDTSGYDIIKGWRADSSYFVIAKNFVRGNIDVSILDRLLKLGDLGVQYCLKSKRAMESHTIELLQKLEVVDVDRYRFKYNERDTKARESMRSLIEDTSINKLEVTFDDLLK